VKKALIYIKNRIFSLPFFLFLFTFLIYLQNLSRFVYGGDTGDLLLAIGVKGVAHPSGYPLFTLIGIIFSFLPPPQPLPYKIALLSAVFSSLSVVFLYLICSVLTKNKIVSVISALTLSFSYIFWLYAELAEVFALGVFFFLVLLYLALKYQKENKNIYLYYLSFFTGLSLSHHLMIILIFPSIAILVLGANKKLIFDYKLLFKCFFLLILGLLPYLYIPIAASKFPVYSWDNAINLKNFIHLVSRADYSWGVSTILKESIRLSLKMRMLAILKYFLDLTYLTTPFVLFLSLLGAVSLLLKRKFLILISLSLAYTALGPFFIFYSLSPNIVFYTGGVIERFYTFSLIFVLILYSLGCVIILNFLEILIRLKPAIQKRENLYKFLFYFALFIIPVYLFKFNYEKTNLSTASIGEQLGKDYLSMLPPNSILIISGDTNTLNTLYVQHILGFRKDVMVINKQVPSLNLKEVKKIYPEFLNVREDNLRLREKIDQLVFDRYKKNKVFFSYGSLSGEDKNFAFLPYGLVLRMKAKNFVQSEKDFIEETDKIWKNMKYKKFSDLTEAERTSQILSNLKTIYSQAAFSTGVFFMRQYSNFEEAIKYFELAEAIDPDDIFSKLGRANIYFIKKDCKNSERIMLDLKENNPREKLIYGYLYLIYDKCFSDKTKAKKIESIYEEKFKEKIPAGDQIFIR